MIKVLKKINKSLNLHNLDVFLVSNPKNVSYLSGFTGMDSYLLIFKSSRPAFLTDNRYLLQAKKELKGFDIICNNEPLVKKLAQKLKSEKIRTLGVESLHLSYGSVVQIQKALKIRLRPLAGLVENLRIIKTDSEIEKIKKSIRISLKSFNETIRFIKPQKSELEIAGFLEFCMRKFGATNAAFPSIVACSRNSALCHAVPSNKKIKRQQPIIIDFGCCYKGYNSDLTRTIMLGKIDASYMYIYNIVKQAQSTAISAIKPGIKASVIDKIARDYIESHGFGRFFIHSTGHGIGRDVHELPSISQKSNYALRPGMVFTVEPGIYIPGWGGVRIEDMVLVTAKACKILTR